MIAAVIFTLAMLYSCSGAGKEAQTSVMIDSSEPADSVITSAVTENYLVYTVYYEPKFTFNSTPELAAAGGETIVADIILDTDGLSRFANGSTDGDCSSAIQNAIYAVYNAGGGTVYLPEGIYRVGSPITVMPFVTLSGAGDNTIIAAYVKPSEEELPALFTLGGSGGVRDLTVYYPEQTVENPQPYPFTFYIPGQGTGGNPANYMLPCLENVTVVNGWRGVVASKYDGYVNEQIYIEGFSGTFLSTGFELYNSADASVFRDIVVSPSVWANFDGNKYGFRASPSESDIAVYTANNLTAFILGDLEWSQWKNITADSCLYGMKAVKGFRAALSAIFYNISLTGCKYGLTVEDMDARTGFSLAFTGGEIGGSDYAVKNETLGKVSFVDAVVNGNIVGVGASRVVTENYGLSLPAEADKSLHTAPTRLTVVTADKNAETDAAPAIQAALDAAAAAGGGVVYLPAGRYRLQSRLVIPSGVELRGAGSLPTRDQMELSLGTMLFFYGITGDSASDAFITLGDNSGLYNLRAFCADVNQYAAYMNGKFIPQPYMVRIAGNNSEIRDFAAAGILNGIKSDGATGTYIDAISIECYVNAIEIDGGSAYVGRVLDNLTVGFRNGWWKFSNYKSMFPSGWEKSAELALSDGDAVTPFHITMDNLTELSVTGGASVRAEDIFSYAAQTTLSCDSAKVTAINLGRDCYYGYTVNNTNPTVKVSNGGETAVYNLHRFNGISYIWDNSGSLEIYNRSTINEDEDSFTGKTKAETQFNTDGKYPKALTIDNCDTKDGWKGAKLDTDIFAEGTGSLSDTANDTMILEKSFSALDISAYRDGYIYLNVYIEDTSILAGNAFLELSSSGRCDINEISWGLDNSLFKNGWNELMLPVSDGMFTGGEPDFSAINYLRIYIFTNGKNLMRLDNIKIGSKDDYS